jgi:hypothetical protein
VRDNWSLMLLHGVVISSCFVLGIWIVIAVSYSLQEQWRNKD